MRYEPYCLNRLRSLRIKPSVIVGPVLGTFGSLFAVPPKCFARPDTRLRDCETELLSTAKKETA